MKTFTGTITHEPTKVAKDCYSLSMIAENGTEYLVTVNGLTRDNMQLKRGRKLRAQGAAYANPTTGISEISPRTLMVVPRNCPSAYRARKRTPRQNYKKVKPQMSFAI